MIILALSSARNDTTEQYLSFWMTGANAAELKKKNKELEQFNKLFVGRELGIKELKEKFKE